MGSPLCKPDIDSHRPNYRPLVGVVVITCMLTIPALAQEQKGQTYPTAPSRPAPPPAAAGQSSVKVNSGELHTRVGGYSGQDHRTRRDGR